MDKQVFGSQACIPLHLEPLASFFTYIYKNDWEKDGGRYTQETNTLIESSGLWLGVFISVPWAFRGLPLPQAPTCSCCCFSLEGMLGYCCRFFKTLMWNILWCFCHHCLVDAFPKTPWISWSRASWDLLAITLREGLSASLSSITTNQAGQREERLFFHQVTVFGGW